MSFIATRRFFLHTYLPYFRKLMMVGPHDHHSPYALCPTLDGLKYVLERAVNHFPCIVVAYAQERILKSGRVTLNSAQIRPFTRENIQFQLLCMTISR